MQSTIGEPGTSLRHWHLDLRASGDWEAANSDANRPSRDQFSIRNLLRQSERGRKSPATLEPCYWVSRATARADPSKAPEEPSGPSKTKNLLASSAPPASPARSQMTDARMLESGAPPLPIQ